MIPPWATILISLSSAILTLVTEVNRLAAEFSLNYLHGKDMPEEFPALGTAFYHSWATVAGQVKALFSNSTYQAFDKMERIIFTAPLYSTHEVEDRVSRVAEFTRTRDTALQAFYKEIGVLKGETRWSRFKRWLKG
jgi:hypothetical protein